MPLFTDQTGYGFELNEKPLRIVSTVPSQTELLFDLGLQEEVVGVTAYCVHPETAIKEKVIIGGTKDLQIKKILDLKPNLVIGNKEENIREQIEHLRRRVPVWLSDVETITDAFNMITGLGEITYTEDRADTLLATLKDLREALKPLKKQLNVAYFIWKDPYMLAGSNTFIGSMLQECGFINAAPADSHQRYPQVSIDEVVNLNVDVILLSSEPYAFTANDAHLLAAKVPQVMVKVVDGELFSWYGSRMLKSYTYFKKLLGNL